MPDLRSAWEGRIVPGELAKDEAFYERAEGQAQRDYPGWNREGGLGFRWVGSRRMGVDVRGRAWKWGRNK